ncbi:LOW QUALITY PROTEIN: hypothetical protein CH63R_08280 [Colletotrichum higginsianum IMI 349063]|uniref:Uncharacterized protein n=1 Tax=Colletotrichum higginsianum (strain IMI 349063) TaxID=759273 RepID=A0A1B7YC26_COLHI|nr:LOW QUALITY PROTEIN: hypothetical protein CH63R_08280 [Colletotrichum higginsianum IMI 349063]OBR09515.1 LOW QUALITY PROTEIN: hypothetical protein CH63R_08280 [Colletotrichum higginsianum IMI 349063]
MPLHADKALTEIWKLNGPFRSAIALRPVCYKPGPLGVTRVAAYAKLEPLQTLLNLPSKTTSRIYAETTTFSASRHAVLNPKANRLMLSSQARHIQSLALTNTLHKTKLSSTTWLRSPRINATAAGELSSSDFFSTVLTGLQPASIKLSLTA